MILHEDFTYPEFTSPAHDVVTQEQIYRSIYCYYNYIIYIYLHIDLYSVFAFCFDEDMATSIEFSLRSSTFEKESNECRLQNPKHVN